MSLVILVMEELNGLKTGSGAFVYNMCLFLIVLCTKVSFFTGSIPYLCKNS